MFTDYLDLRTAVIDQVGNADRVTPVFDRITKMAEQRLNRELRTHHQIKSLSITISSGVGYLPGDLLEVIGLYDANGNELIAGSDADREAGRCMFTIRDFQIAGPDGTYTLRYYEALDSITYAVDGVNWLLTNEPDLYYWAVCEEAAKFLKDVEGARAFAELRGDAMSAVRGNDERKRYSRARVRVKGPTP